MQTFTYHASTLNNHEKPPFVNACKSQLNPKKLLTDQIRRKKVSVCIPFGFAKGTSVKNSDHVTIIDVAREAGVSYALVSRMLNNEGNVKPETRERVLTAMTRLGYVVDQRAQSLAGGRSVRGARRASCAASLFIGEKGGVLFESMTNNFPILK